MTQASTQLDVNSTTAVPINANISFNNIISFSIVPSCTTNSFKYFSVCIPFVTNFIFIQ